VQEQAVLIHGGFDSLIEEFGNPWHPDRAGERFEVVRNVAGAQRPNGPTINLPDGRADPVGGATESTYEPAGLP
jgi:hypothetical protein